MILSDPGIQEIDLQRNPLIDRTTGIRINITPIQLQHVQMEGKNESGRSEKK
jgi:hypothetical protein